MLKFIETINAKYDRAKKVRRVKKLLSQENFRDGLDLAKEIIVDDLRPLTVKAMDYNFFDQRLGKPLEYRSDLTKLVPALLRPPLIDTLMLELAECIKPSERLCAGNGVIIRNDTSFRDGKICFRFLSDKYDDSALLPETVPRLPITAPAPILPAQTYAFANKVVLKTKGLAQIR